MLFVKTLNQLRMRRYLNIRWRVIYSPGKYIHLARQGVAKDFNMSVKKTAYDTTACQGFVMQKTVHALQDASVRGWLEWVPGSAVRQVTGGAGSDGAIPAFAHPVLFALNNHQELVVDVRPFGRQEAGQFRVKNPTEYALQITRAKLNWVWIKDPVTYLRDLSPMPLAIFATWIAEQLTRRFALDPSEQLAASIYAGVFYLSNFIEQVDYHFSEQDKVRVTNAISRSLRVKPQDVLKVLDTHGAEGCPAIADVKQFCQMVSGVSVRLKELNAGVLFAILGATWYGTHAKEMVAVALEHPPTWIAILLAAVNERSFKNSGITKITERSGFRDMARSYQAAVLNLLANTGDGNDIAPDEPVAY